MKPRNHPPERWRSFRSFILSQDLSGIRYRLVEFDSTKSTQSKDIAMNSSSWPHKPDTHHAICFQCKDIQYITWCFAHISDVNLPKSINSQIELVQKNTFIEVVKSSIVCWISELLVPTFQLTKKCWLGFVPSASSAVQRGPALASFGYQRFHPGSSSLTQGNASHRSTNLFSTCCLANNPFPGPTSSFKMGQSFRWWMYTCKFQLLRVSENERQRLV